MNQFCSKLRRNAGTKHHARFEDCVSSLQTQSGQCLLHDVGTKRFQASTGRYEEDESPGACDIEFNCPNCKLELDPEKVIA
jgi:hypothetical protein